MSASAATGSVRAPRPLAAARCSRHGVPRDASGSPPDTDPVTTGVVQTDATSRSRVIEAHFPSGTSFRALAGSQMDRKLERLRKRSDFLAAARGRKRVERGVVLQANFRNDENPPRVGFTVTRKVGGAVLRNRTKRRLRAAAAEILPLAAKDGYDYVLIGRQDTATRRWPELLSDLKIALSKVHGRSGGPTPSASAASRSDSGKDAPHG